MTEHSFVRKNAVLVYFVLTVVLSWGAVLLIVGFDGLPVAADQIQIVGMAMLLGPSVAGIVMTALCGGKAGLRTYGLRLIKWRVGAGWYAYAIFIAPVTTAATLLMLMPVSSDFTINLASATDRGGLILTGVVAGLFVGLFEERWVGLDLLCPSSCADGACW